MAPRHTGTICYPKTSRPIFLTARQVAGAYNFPMDSATGKGYVGGFIELGGGYDPNAVAGYFRHAKLPMPSFTDVNVVSGSNSPGDPGPDGEVQSDMIVAGSVAPDVDYRIYFAGNTDEEFLAAIKQATKECHGVSISWGSAESNWPSNVMKQFAFIIDAARARGVPVFVAAGDSGADDGTGTPTADFPASAPSSIGCGGTRLLVNSDGTRALETVWDDNPTQSATGGGVSRMFPGRQIPDIAGNADPDTGYLLAINGRMTVIGGTSLVAPLMLGLHALLSELHGIGSVNLGSFDLLSLITANPATCFDITGGDNGAFRAGPGRDNCTGFGVPDGGRLAALLAATPPVPGPA